MNDWILKVEVNGEWEECSFPTRNEAVSAFTALAADYNVKLQKAVLIAPASLREYERPASDRPQLGRPN